jgi:glucokinase
VDTTIDAIDKGTPMGDAAQKNLAIGVDMGGTNLRAAVVDQNGQLLASIRTASPIADPTKGQETLIQAICDVAARAAVQPTALCGVGLGIPGWMDRVTGRLAFAPKMAHWQDVFDLAAIQAELCLPLYVDSDPNVATLGELWMGAGRGSRNMVMITLGTGLGCGIVIDGKLYAGHHGMSGEFGHIVVNDFSEVPCDCGVIGCLETQAAGPAIARQGKLAVASGRDTLMSSLVDGCASNVTTSTVFAAAADGDPVARAIIEHAGELLGTGLATLVSLFEPEKIIIGGGMADRGEPLLEPMRRTMASRCYLISMGYVSVDLVLAHLGDTAGMIGAAKLAFVGQESRASEARLLAA